MNLPATPAVGGKKIRAKPLRKLNFFNEQNTVILVKILFEIVFSNCLPPFIMKERVAMRVIIFVHLTKFQISFDL